MKTDEDENAVLVAAVTGAAGAGAAARGGEGAEKSNRSPSAEGAGLGAAAAGLAAGGAEGEAKPPNPPKPLEVPPTDDLCWWLAGLESKKLPPLKLEKALLLAVYAGGLVMDEAVEPRGEVKAPRLAKASV